MHYFSRRPFDLSPRQHTPQEVYTHRKHHRREFLKMMGLTAVTTPFALTMTGCSKPSDQEILDAGSVKPKSELSAKIYPAPRNSKFEYGRPETPQRAAAEYSNFYEFTGKKDVWRLMPQFHPEDDWKIEVSGMCRNPKTFDMDDIYRLLKSNFEERAYRHRCVETWAMCIPWTGFPFRELLKLVDPKPEAHFVALETFGFRDDAPKMNDTSYPWPYRESLSIQEAMNDLAFLATGIYGEPLPKQHGTPLRLVVPWKYGFKSIKSLVNIRLVQHQPGTFWNEVWPEAYSIDANVNPDVRHPSWSQKSEWMLGPNRDRYPTQHYNGYGDYVAKLY